MYINSGTYGKIYECGNNSVVKIVDIFNEPESLCQPNLQEIVFLKLYQHPNISVLKSAKISNDLFHIELQKYDTNLENYIRNTEEGERERYFEKIFFPIISALNFMHLNGFIHGDIKPSNIMLDADMNAKLIDFGGICSFRLTEKHSCICTACYSPPEGWDKFKKGAYSGSFDVWSLGIVMMYYLKKTYGVDAAEETNEAYISKFNELMTGHKRLLTDLRISKKVRKWLNKMLYFDASRRISMEKLLERFKFEKVPCQKVCVEAVYDNAVYIGRYGRSNIVTRRRMIDIIYDLCKYWATFDCLVLSVVIIDMYCKVVGCTVNRSNYRVLACCGLMLASNLISENTYHIKHFKKVIKRRRRQLIIQMVKNILVALDFKIYFTTFELLLERVDYAKVRQVLYDINNVGKSNQVLCELVL